jgi:capsular exopolysaccharide synthesis family protein
MAARIANSYANAFVAYENKRALTDLRAAEDKLTMQINAIDAQLPNVTSTSQSTALATEEASLKGELTRLQVYGTQGPGGVQVEVAATLPKAPSGPKKVENGLLGLLGGLVFGLGMVLLMDRVDDKIRSEDDLERSGLGYQVFGVIPMIGRRWKRDRPQVLVTSPAAIEGKTTAVANLGVAMASTGQRVVLVSSDLRRPQLATLFGLHGEVGLTTMILERINVKQAVQPVSGVNGLSVLASGPIPANPAETLGSSDFACIVRRLYENFNVVIFDGPPLLPVTDSMILAQIADVTLLVVAEGQTTHSQLGRACQKLDRARVTNVGLGGAERNARTYRLQSRIVVASPHLRARNRRKS